MSSSRCCSRNGCDRSAVATLTYIYAASTAVVGPLAVGPEPHTYDLCQSHADSLTAPRGWELVRHDGRYTPPEAGDDLAALAEAVREAPTAGGADAAGTAGRHRGHLRVIPPA